MQLDPAVTGADTVVAIARYALLWTLGATIVAGTVAGVLRRPPPDPHPAVSGAAAALSGPCRPGWIIAMRGLPPPATGSLGCRIRVPAAQWSSRTPDRGG
jgi:hypothetical protein